MSGLRFLHPVYAVSAALHIAGGMFLTSIQEHRPPPETIVVEMRTLKKPPKPVPPPPTPLPPEPEPAPPAPKEPPKERPKAPPPPPVPAPEVAAPDFGVSLKGMGSGGDGGPGGIAVPVGDPGGVVRQTSRTLEAPAPAPTPKGGCSEDEVKAKATQMPRPTYTEEARAAEVEGKVRVELSIGTDGQVTAARVLSGLGMGLDEAALEAVRGASFSPATRCGKPVASTFTVSVRFAL